MALRTRESARKAALRAPLPKTKAARPTQEKGVYTGNSAELGAGRGTTTPGKH